MNIRTMTTISGTAVVAVVATLVVGRFLPFGQTPQVRADDSGSRASPSTGVSVEVAQPVRRPLVRALHMPATLQAGEAADLFAKVSGYVSTVAVDIGSRVEKGQVLVRISVPEMADELRQAQALLEATRAKVRALQARAVQAETLIATARAEIRRRAAEYDLRKITVDRQEQLRRENAISQQDFDEVISKLAIADAQVKIAQAGLASAQAQKQAVEADGSVVQSELAVEEARLAQLNTLMEYATIRAPFDGVITDRLVDPGAFVRSAAEGNTTPLLTIANVSYIRLVLEIPESDAPHVRVGTEVEIDVTALEEEPIGATIARTAVALKTNTRTMRVEVDLDNKNGRLAPGMYAKVTVTLEFKQQALVIPSKAIRVRGRDVSVLVVEDAVARARPIKIGYDDGIWAEVLEGLSGDERIIVSAGSAVAPGAPVSAVLTES